jgi:DNA mismatch repair endonuclease MutH
MAFDYRTATEAEILSLAKELPGSLVGDLTATSFTDLGAAHGKAEVGHAVEAYFGIPKNSRAEADFPGAGIELKAVPLLRTGSKLRVKERTFVSRIDYMRIVEETWDTAKVRGKLDILFVFYEHLLDQPKTAFPIRAIDLFIPDDRHEEMFRADWERVRTKVRHGQAHLLRERDGRVLTPSTKSATGSDRSRQPFSDEPAKPRAFALKAAFALERYRQTMRSQPASESLIVNLGMKRVDTFEEKVLARFHPYLGKTLGQIGDELKVPPSSAKSYAASVVRRIVGARSSKSRIAEFEEMGLTLRMTRVRPDLRPYEALSFPAFRYRSLIQETWEDSDLLSRVENMLLVPIHGDTRSTPPDRCALGAPVSWRPSAPDLDLIHREWELFRLEIERGQADRLTPASETEAIHVRPHARNAEDTDDAPGVGPLIKKSFWLNQAFVRSILRGER